MPEVIIPKTIIQQNGFKGLPPIFADCAAQEDGFTYDLSLPWRHGKHVWSGSGPIVVRMPLACIAIIDRERLRNVHRVPGKAVSVFDVHGPWRAEPIGYFDVKETHPCERCEGTGTTYWQGHEIACDDCDGDGWIYNLDAVEVAPGYQLAGHYLAMLQRHGASIFLPEGEGLTKGDACLFRIGEAQGLLMPLLVEKPKELVPPPEGMTGAWLNYLSN